MAEAFRTCSIGGCNRPHVARGYCKSHYNRLKLYGDAKAGNPVKGTGLQWLLENANHDGEDCLIWPFARVSQGYGSVWVGRLNVGTHRLMCMLKHGQPPTSDCEAAHSCGNGHLGCCNPRHLSWKTPTDNSADKLRHGTHNRGENCARAKLTAADVLKIRELSGKMSRKAIADLFGIGPQAIGKILNGQRWSHLSGPSRF